MTDDASMPVKPICFYLPQFHAIPENDAWWGKRFTEWSLVKAATPQFATHRQPREPIAELGYYDLLDSDVRRRQGEIARAHGVYGFCYYHYWFDGKRLLERPLEKMLTDGEPDLPFCLCWANEPWSRRWDGSDQEVLQAQNYGDAAGWDAHFNCLLRFFEHPNYIRVQGRPLLVVYRLGDIDDGPAMIDAWRRRAESAGLPGLHLVAALNHQAPDAQQLAAVDAACEFLPNYLYPQERMRIRRFGILGLQCAEEGWRGTLSLPKAHRVQYRGVFRSWDNTPRFRDRGVVTIDSDTATFRALLDRQFQRAATDPDLPEPFVFVNSWNEWGEGTYLEPDREHGFSWLETLRDAVQNTAATSSTDAPAISARILETTDGFRGPDEIFGVLLRGQIRAGRLLAVECGDGSTARTISQFLRAGHCTGIDRDASVIPAASRRLDVACLLDFETTTPDAIPGKTEPFDILIALCCLERVREPGEVLRTWATAVRPGGHVLLSVPNVQNLRVLTSIVEGDWRYADGGPVEPQQVRFFSMKSLDRLLDGAGLERMATQARFDPVLDGGQLKSAGNTVSVGRLTIRDLSAGDVRRLHASHYMILARRT